MPEHEEWDSPIVEIEREDRYAPRIHPNVMRIEMLERVKQDGRDAYHKRENANPQANIPTLLNSKNHAEWEDKLEAWRAGYIEESRKR